ncbi:MAG: hypothetical protein M3273_01270 [Actinomycetota bacterium]|nr:hypothetical protein [Actinomycetota bacterium]
MMRTETPQRANSPRLNRCAFVPVLLVGSMLTTSCAAEPDPELGREIEEFGRGLGDLGEGLHDMGAHLSDAGESLSGAMCELGKGFAKGKKRAQYEKYCPDRPKKKR